MVSTCSWPSQSAITVVSTPACSSRIAAVWRSTCGVIVFAFSDGQRFGGVGGVLGEAALERVAAEGRAGAGREQRLAGAPPRSASQTVEHGDGRVRSAA